MSHNQLFKQNLTLTSETYSKLLLSLMFKYSVPKRKIVDLLINCPTTIEDLVEFLTHMEEYCENFNSKKARNKLICYKEFRLQGISNYKCCVLLTDWEGELG